MYYDYHALNAGICFEIDFFSLRQSFTSLRTLNFEPTFNRQGFSRLLYARLRRQVVTSFFGL